MKNFLFLICLLLSFKGESQPIRFVLPLEGQNGKDYFLCRYVDHDPSSGIRDMNCGNKTYDGHLGTDFLIRSFKTMDSGVRVHSVADGIVQRTVDNNYDREKNLDERAQPNYVVILHKDGSQTYYYHLKKNSIIVKEGDSVRSGEVIGMVGSSGYSTGPHLHLEVHDKNNKVIDPFIGPCSLAGSSMWIAQPIYDTSKFSIECGFIPYVPSYDSLKERYLVSDSFYLNEDTTVYFWVLVHGLQKGNILTAKWFSPSGDLWASVNYKWENNWWYDYTWPFIKLPRFKGKWEARLYVNEKLIAQRNFFIARRR